MACRLVGAKPLSEPMLEYSYCENMDYTLTLQPSEVIYSCLYDINMLSTRKVRNLFNLSFLYTTEECIVIEQMVTYGGCLIIEVIISIIAQHDYATYILPHEIRNRFSMCILYIEQAAKPIDSIINKAE